MKLTAEERETKANVLKELKQYRQELNAGQRAFLNGSEEVKELIEDWKRLRPKMVKKYQRMGILKEFAQVCLERRDDSLMHLKDAQMDTSDARAEANQNLLLWDEEDDNLAEREAQEAAEWEEFEKRLAAL
jgi:hypothetical protein